MTTTRMVCKWTVPVDDQWHPIGAGPVLHVADQNQTGTSVQVWTEEPTGVHRTHTAARVYATGQPLPGDAHHAGSVVTSGGGLVWHLYRGTQERADREPTR